MHATAKPQLPHLQPRPVRSRPDLIFPPCPTCFKPVDQTLTYEARAVVDQATATQYTDRAPEPNDPARQILYVGANTEPAVLEQLALVDVGGAPDKDQVQAMPCTCVQHGRTAHEYLTAAMNLTHPDIRIEIRVTVPALLLDDSAGPSFLSASSVLDAADTLEAQARGDSPITRALLGAVEQLAPALPEPHLPRTAR